MLEDIISNTTIVFNHFIPKDKSTSSIKNVYDLYRAMGKMLDNIHLVSEHYLALSFEEGYLQNSSFGEPSDKWRYFFNKDLESLNESIQNYLQALNHIAPKKANSPCSSYLSNMYNPKTFYSFVRDHYNVGLVKPCGFELTSVTLALNGGTEILYIENYSKIDLSNYEKRVVLQSDLRIKYNLLKDEFAKLKSYLLKNCTLNDLL